MTNEIQTTITMNCIECGDAFGQPPHPATVRAFYYTCPKCQIAAHKSFKKGLARDAAGIYCGIKH